MNQNQVMNLDTELPLPSISSSAVLAELSIAAWNPQRKDTRVTDKVHTQEGINDADGGQYIKRLFPAIKAFQQIKTLEMRARHMHKRLTMPWSDAGQRLLVISMLPEYVAGITEVEGQFWDVVRGIQADYPVILRDCKIKLGATFDINLYPTMESIPNHFRFQHNRIPVPEMNDYDRIASSAVTIMKEEFTKKLEYVRDGVLEEVKDSARKVLERMSVTLDFEGDEDKKTFKNTLVDNVKEWHDKVGKFNEVTKLQSVDALYGQVGDVLKTCSSPELLRHSAEVRRDVKAKVDRILRNLDF